MRTKLIKRTYVAFYLEKALNREAEREKSRMAYQRGIRLATLGEVAFVNSLVPVQTNLEIIRSGANRNVCWQNQR